jgi:hypothetical protein
MDPYIMEKYGEVKIWLHAFLNCPQSIKMNPAALAPRERAPGMYCIGG